MNKQQERIIENSLLQFVRNSNRFGSHINSIRINPANGYAHELKKFEVCYNLLKDGKRFLTEAIFNTGGIADVLNLSDKEIIEILNTEKEENCLEKTKKYPKVFHVNMVKVDK